MVFFHHVVQICVWPNLMESSLLCPNVRSCCCAGSVKLLKRPEGSRPLSPRSDSPSWRCSPADDPDRPWNQTAKHLGETRGSRTGGQTENAASVPVGFDLTPLDLLWPVLTSPARGRSCWRFRTCLSGWLCGGVGVSGADWVPESPGPSSSASCSRVWRPPCAWCCAGRSAWRQRNDPWREGKRVFSGQFNFRRSLCLYERYKGLNTKTYTLRNGMQPNKLPPAYLTSSADFL